MIGSSLLVAAGGSYGEGGYEGSYEAGQPRESGPTVLSSDIIAPNLERHIADRLVEIGCHTWLCSRSPGTSICCCSTRCCSG